MSTRFGALSGHDVSAIEEQQKDEEREQVDYKMVTFSLGGKDYGIDIMKVKEIAKFQNFTFVPNTASFVRGVYNLRGDIISIIDLRTMFQLPSEPKPEGTPEEGLIIRLEDRLLGVVVDEIDKVVGIHSETIQPPHPIFGDINIKYISGVVEYDERLYIILDVDRVFAKEMEEESRRQSQQRQAGEAGVAPQEHPRERVDEQVTAAAKEGVPEQETGTAAAAPESSELDFITESLAAFGALYVSDINRAWVEQRFKTWKRDRDAAGKTVQFETREDAAAFLNGFHSPYSGEFWGPDYAEAVRRSLPELRGNAMNAWNPGCGRGFETYSFTVLCKETYPEARLKIWASDNDLLSISTAPNLVFSIEAVPERYRGYLVSGSNGYSFRSDIKDAIVFEYHDVAHDTTVPELDVVLMRDLLSLLPAEQQRGIISTALSRLRGGGILVAGKNEDLTHVEELERIDSEVNAYRKSKEASG